MPLLFIKKYWKFAALAIVLFGAFTVGKRWEAAKYEKERADMATAVSKAIIAREKQIRIEHQAQLVVDTTARESLQTDLATLRTRERDLLGMVDELSLVKTITTVVVEGCENNEEGQRVVLANPFTDDFVQLWNEAGGHPVGE